jgi:Methenyltetrahydromethanopterin cyclohydrolase
MATKLKDGRQEPVEELYKELDYQDSNDTTVLVIENDAVPPIEIVEKVAAACKIEPSKLTIIVTPTSSLAGGVQVVARVLEVAMHKAHALHFPLENIIDGSGSAPICPPHPNLLKRWDVLMMRFCLPVKYISLSKAAMKPLKNWLENYLVQPPKTMASRLPIFSSSMNTIFSRSTQCCLARPALL